MAEPDWTPAFPGQRPPFPPGHELSVQHGAYSPRKVDPLAAEFVALVDADPKITWLTAADRPALWSLGQTQAQIQLLTEYLAKAGEKTGDGVGDLDQDRVNRAYLLLHRAEARALTLRARLGLDPLSRARLGRDRAATEVDVARLMAEMHRQEQERLEREARQVNGEIDEDEEQA